MDGAWPRSAEHTPHLSPSSRLDALRTGMDVTSASKTPTVHVNPNFRNGKSLVIHVNPKMHQNRKIHVNPKMMKGMAPIVEPLKNVAVPAIGDGIFCNAARTEPEIQKSIHVNPKLVSKLRSNARAEVKAAGARTVSTDRNEATRTVRTKSARLSVSDDTASGKSATPRLLAISRRKLVRVGTNTKRTSVTSPLKKINRRSLTVVQVTTKSSANSPNATSFGPAKNKHKINAYKIDRTAVERTKSKKTRIPNANVRNVNKGLVTIGGVMYRSSRTQLVRSDARSSSHKRKSYVSSSTNVRGDAFVMAKNGKKLHRLQTVKGAGVQTYVVSRNSFNCRAVVKKVPNSIVQTSLKNVISYKAKQRSLQILRDKLRKNYIPCLLYRRFGYCAKHAKGTCPKLHDKKQIALCKNFLQGKCLLDNCPLSHDIGPEKMPTCKYFLEGCCIRDQCPYLHVKVSSNTPICAQFLRGYCIDGNKCKHRHTNICPDYEKTGSCAKGKYCPYPHKLKPLTKLVTKPRASKNHRSSSANKRTSNHSPSKVPRPSEQDSRKRYYDKAPTSDEQLAQMRENIIKKMRCTKACEKSVEERDKAIDRIDVDGGVDKSDRESGERPRRTPIGPLPAYIPIN